MGSSWVLNCFKYVSRMLCGGFNYDLKDIGNSFLIHFNSVSNLLLVCFKGVLKWNLVMSLKTGALAIHYAYVYI